MKLARLSPIVVLAALLGACAYDPPALGDHTAAAYQKDLGACRATASDAADAQVKKRGYTYLFYPVTYPLAERAQMRDCMQAHGHAPAPG